MSRQVTKVLEEIRKIADNYLTINHSYLLDIGTQSDITKALQVLILYKALYSDNFTVGFNKTITVKDHDFPAEVEIIKNGLNQNLIKYTFKVPRTFDVITQINTTVPMISISDVSIEVELVSKILDCNMAKNGEYNSSIQTEKLLLGCESLKDIMSLVHSPILGLKVMITLAKETSEFMLADAVTKNALEHVFGISIHGVLINHENRAKLFEQINLVTTKYK